MDNLTTLVKEMSDEEATEAATLLPDEFYARYGGALLEVAHR